MKKIFTLLLTLLTTVQGTLLYSMDEKKDAAPQEGGAAFTDLQKTFFDAKDNQGNTAIDKAAQKGRLDNVALFIKSGYDINRPDDNGSTPLHRAAERNQTTAIQTLLAAGADIDAKNNAGSTPLMCAIYNLRPEACQLLVERNASIEESDNQNWSPIALINYFTSNIDSKVEAVLLAQPQRAQEEIIASCNRIQSILQTRYQFLMQAANMTPLMDACRQGNDALVLELLQDQATQQIINTQDCQGRTALMYAVINGGSDLIEPLYKAGASLDLDIRDEDGLHLFHHAAQARDIDGMEFILTHIPEDDIPSYINALTHNDQTPLMFVADSIQEEVVEYLINKGANPLLRNKNDCTALTFAINAWESIKDANPNVPEDYLASKNNLIKDLLQTSEHETEHRLKEQQKRFAQQQAQLAQEAFETLMKEPDQNDTLVAQATTKPSAKKKKKKKKSITPHTAQIGNAQQPSHSRAAAIAAALAIPEYQQRSQIALASAPQQKTRTFAQRQQQEKKKQQDRERRERKIAVRGALDDIIGIVERGYDEEQEKMAELARIAAINKAQEDALRMEVHATLTDMVNKVQDDHDDIEAFDNKLADIQHAINIKHSKNQNLKKCFSMWRMKYAQSKEEKEENERLMLRQSPVRELLHNRAMLAFSQKPPRNYRGRLQATW